MTDWKLMRGGLVLLFADLVAGQLDAAILHLFVNDVSPGPGASVADFSEASFTGGESAIVGSWGQPYWTADGRLEVAAPNKQWNYASGTAELVYGVFVVGSGSTADLLGYSRLDVPRPMSTVLDSLIVTPRISLGQATWGSPSEASD